MYELVEIPELIVQHLVGELSEEEQARLEKWLAESEKNRVLFEKICSEKLDRKKLVSYSNDDIEKAFQLFIQERLRLEAGQRKFRLNRFLKYAALWVVPAIIASAIYLVRQPDTSTPAKKAATTTVQSSTLAPTLILSDGKEIVLDKKNQPFKEKNGIQINRRQNGELVYSGLSDTTTELIYNTIITPRQCDYQVVLSDGTKVWINAASELKYPVVFNNSERTVYAKGEIYLEVAKDAARPFYVELDDMKVKVLGTSFNVNSYANEDFASLTLVEGRVSACINNENYHLNPNQQIHIDKVKHTARIRNVEVRDYISWKEGVYVFKNHTLSEVAKTIERWYDIRVVFQHSACSQAIYTGVIYKEEDINAFMKRLEKSSGFNCQLGDNTLYINNY